MSSLKVKCFTLGQLKTNCFVITDKINNNCVVIDPGEDPEPVLRYIKDKTVDYILLTHSHHDHIAGLNEIRKMTGGLVAIHHEEAQWLLEPNLNLSYQSKNPIVCNWPDIVLYGGEVIKWNNHLIKSIHTPGHSPGGTCYLIEQYLFSGDTLMEGVIGITYGVPYGNREKLKQSIRNKLFTLEDGIKVMPGHGNLTSIGMEKRYNLLPNVKSFSRD
ncbi:MBL fold metallo-hydrolase [Pueribacillus theae]|uniref:MBL fold metallo-hydrolase n=1 Tax=Pueribacillus theae TaxID=2171751 RepID=A0A2U1K3N9_9BACI|nr:MBL fold metallo-hydrolase [Pueribacillus theae]PWA11794.1 MBL fold metallo-hydrolase [Pueribacillus theae]